jgi:hypothetical protein
LSPSRAQTSTRDESTFGPSPARLTPRSTVPRAFARPVWYLHRLRAMPLKELPFRAAEQFRRARSRRRFDSPTEPVPGRRETGLADLVLGWAGQPGVAAYWAEQAAAVSAGEVSIFGRRWTTASDGLPDWDLDPLSGYRWPQDYCFDVSLAPATPVGAEVKYVWELNRLLYLLPVAAQAATQGDDRLRDLCRGHLESWIGAHPPRRGVTWRSGIELAIRILAFVLVLELTSPNPDADPGLEARIGGAVADHMSWIRRFPSRYSSANNHRVAELAGLLVAASAYPQLADREEVDRWWTELQAVVVLQFHGDGVPAEQATAYAILVLEWLSLCAHVGRRHGRTLSPETRRRVGAAVGFLTTLTDSAGHIVRIGDGDDSRLLTAARPPEDLPRAVCGLVADELAVPIPAASSGLSTYAEGGYTSWRSGSGVEEILWVLDHGDLGMGRLAAHAHADTLAVYLHVGGRPVLVDAGTYLYHSSEDWRDRLRTTAEHNTVALGAEDSSIMAGPFNWRAGHRAEGRLVAAGSAGSGWCVEAEHAGYVGRFGVVHRRWLEGRDARSFRLRDRLEGGSGDLAFRWSLLLAPGLEVVPTDTGWMVREDGIDLLSLAVAPPWHSSATQEGAWCSPSFGQIEPTSRLLIEGSVDQTTSIDVEITVVTGGRA